MRALISLMNFRAEASWSNEEQQTWTPTSQDLDEGREQRQVSEPGTREDPEAAPSRPGAAGNQSEACGQPRSGQPTMRVPS